MTAIEIEEFADFLTHRLGPDCIESGSTATGEDFIKAGKVINALLAEMVLRDVQLSELIIEV